MRKANILGLVTTLSLAFSSTLFAATPAKKDPSEPADKSAATETKVHHKHHAHHHKHHAHHHKHHAHHHHHKHHHHHVRSPFDGYYVGGSAGGGSTNATHERDSQFNFSTNLALPFNNNFNESGPVSLKTFNSVIGALYAGYGQCWDDLYLGAEIFIDLANYKNHDDLNSTDTVLFPGGPATFIDNSSRTTSTRLSPFQFGIDLRPGFIMTPESMLYARVGVAFAEKTVRVNDRFSGSWVVPGAAAPWDIALSAEEEKDVAALRLGAGVETHICHRWNLRMDYIYTYYGHNTISGSTVPVTIDVGGSATTVSAADSSNVKIYTNTVMLGLTYQI